MKAYLNLTPLVSLVVFLICSSYAFTSELNESKQTLADRIDTIKGYEKPTVFADGKLLRDGGGNTQMELHFEPGAVVRSNPDHPKLMIKDCEGKGDLNILVVSSNGAAEISIRDTKVAGDLSIYARDMRAPVTVKMDHLKVGGKVLLWGRNFNVIPQFINKGTIYAVSDEVSVKDIWGNTETGVQVRRAPFALGNIAFLDIGIETMASEEIWEFIKAWIKEKAEESAKMPNGSMLAASEAEKEAATDAASLVQFLPDPTVVEILDSACFANPSWSSARSYLFGAFAKNDMKRAVEIILHLDDLDPAEARGYNAARILTDLIHIDTSDMTSKVLKKILRLDPEYYALILSRLKQFPDGSILLDYLKNRT